MEEEKNNAVLRQTLGEPDPFRLKYYVQIRNVIRQVLIDVSLKTQASAYVNNAAKDLPAVDRQRFVEAVETELLSLHDGNFARHGLTPSQYGAWRAVWDRQD